MRYDPDIHRRRSLRLKGWDYSSPGAYFVTICAWKKECIFADERVKHIALDEWDKIPQKYPSTSLDEFVLMPNHLHGIIWIEPVGAGLALPSYGKTRKQGGPRPAPTLGDIICAFKSRTSVTINRLRNTAGTPVWQRNFYEHIIRNELELDAVRTYIRDNPLRWGEYPENPENIFV